MSFTSPEFSNQFSLPKLINKGMMQVFTNKAVINLKEVERWNFVYVACFSLADSFQIDIVSKILIAITTNDIKMEIILTIHKTLELVIAFYLVDFSNSCFATFNPQLIPKATAKSKNETKYVKNIQKILFPVLTPRFSQNISIGSAALSTLILYPSMYQSSIVHLRNLNIVNKTKLINLLKMFTWKLSQMKTMSLWFIIVTNAEPIKRSFPLFTSSWSLSFSIYFSNLSICH